MIFKILIKYLKIVIHHIWIIGEKRNNEIKFDLLKKKDNTSLGSNIILDSSFICDLYSESSRLILGNNFFCRQYCIFRIGDNANLQIGDNVFINSYCSINCMYDIQIGDNVMFGEGVKIYDHDHLLLKKYPLEIVRNNLKLKNIKIGNNTWLGSNVTILKGVTIGDNVVVGSNCLIFQDIPSNTIVKGQFSYNFNSNFDINE